MLSLKAGPQAKLANLERKPDLYLPYTRHVTRDVIALRSRALMTVIELEGISFETIDNEDLEIFQNQLNMLWRNVASDQLAVWTHMVRKRERHYPDGEFHSDFARELDAKYRTRMVGEELYRNRWFLTLIWVPARDPSAKFSAFVRKVSKSRKVGDEVDERALKNLCDARSNVLAGLDRYRPRLLSVYEKNRLWFSEAMEFLRLISTVDECPMPLVDGPIGGAVYMDRVLFGHEALEIRLPGERKVAGIVGVKEYPATTRAGMLNTILAAPFECVLAQSFAMMSKADAKEVGKQVLIVLAMLVTIAAALLMFFVVMYAQITLGLIIVLGPVFIALALFKQTISFTSSYFGALFNFTILQVLVYALLGLLIGFMTDFFADFSSASGGEQMLAILQLCGFFVLSAFAALQLPGVASALAGSGFSVGGQLIGAAMGVAGRGAAAAGVGTTRAAGNASSRALDAQRAGFKGQGSGGAVSRR